MTWLTCNSTATAGFSFNWLVSMQCITLQCKQNARTRDRFPRWRCSYTWTQLTYAFLVRKEMAELKGNTSLVQVWNSWFLFGLLSFQTLVTGNQNVEFTVQIQIYNTIQLTIQLRKKRYINLSASLIHRLMFQKHYKAESPRSILSDLFNYYENIVIVFKYLVISFISNLPSPFLSKSFNCGRKQKP